MTARDGLIAFIVVLVWGVNFFFIRLGLTEATPMVLGLLRFILVLFPAVLLVKKPAVAWYWLAAYGLTISFGQFALMFTAIAVGMPTGLTALLLQAQVFFTVLMAALIGHEPVRARYWLAMAVAVAGLTLIGIGQHNGTVPLSGLLLVLSAAFSWAVGNMIVKRIGRVDALALVVWGNVICLLPFALCALVQSGADGVWQQISHMNWQGWLAVAFLAYMASLIGYVGWGSLLARYPASKITPLALLVPVVALLISYLFLKENLNVWQWTGIGVMMAALCIQVLGKRKNHDITD